MYHRPAGPATPVRTARVRVRPLGPDPDTGGLADDEVHVWTVPLTATVPEPDPLLGTLSADERARFERYQHPRAKAQFVQSRAALRSLLGGYLRCDPAVVRFAYDPDGKPAAVGPAGTAGPEFNLSHTDGVAVVAVARVPVGVDVEAGRPEATADALVGRFFAPEERDEYRRLAAVDRPAAFLRGWTCKEAILKGVGCGARGLDDCVVTLDPRRPSRIVRLGGAAAGRGVVWGLGNWNLAEGVAVAVAVWGSEEVVTA